MSSADPDFQLALASVHLTPVSAEITNRQLSDKISGFFDEFKYLIHAHVLTAHEVDWSLRHTDEGTDLLFYLRRRRQGQLKLKHAHSESADIYDAEIQRVAECVDSLPERFQRAFKSSANPLRDPDVRTMRQYVRNHPDLQVLRELVESAADFSLRGPSNDVSPHSRQLQVRFVVSEIRRTALKVESLTVTTPNVPADTLTDLRSRSRLHRHADALGTVPGIDFSWSLETCQELEATISVEYEYSSGGVKRLILSSRPSRAINVLNAAPYSVLPPLSP